MIEAADLAQAENFINKWQASTDNAKSGRKRTVEERNQSRERYANLPEAVKEERRASIINGKAERKKERHQVQKAADVLEILLQKTIKGGRADDLEDLQSLSEVAGSNITALAAILLKQMQKAINNGDTRAAEFIMKASGNLVEKQEVAVKPINPLASVSTDDIKLMLAATEEEEAEAANSTPPF